MTSRPAPAPTADDGSGPRLTDRQRAILEAVTRQGFVTIDALARDLDVSAQTIRRDIIQMDRAGVLQRFHGGAGLPENSVRLGYVQKRATAAESKERIAAAALGLIAPDAAVFLDYGTTVEAVARGLAARPQPRVFTASMPAAAAFAGRNGAEVHVTGGTVRGADGSLAGAAALAALDALRVDVAVVGCSGFDEDGAPMDFDLDKVAVKRAMIARARTVILVADGAKFRRTAIARIVEPGRMAHLVTDAAPPAALRQRMEAAGVRIVVG
ncbi:DeoR/GlpR family DNA-binding transcription regulator [Futiania mangrovi]|uniref:DeoR/GlpR family DNA-binding transcription regulator n=1 Tax=Futiania mangrovi TaxID=2959716 RepID=A0A9J6PAX4_9PROT|nr:DeoR/GlpR family DNA-binding transcription regulator [Futiania mangrovii]MCP1337260.1 DeoR/GlpR family DNA-binding transcription regulator [Futiania mangrovii]